MVEQLEEVLNTTRTMIVPSAQPAKEYCAGQDFCEWKPYCSDHFSGFPVDGEPVRARVRRRQLGRSEQMVGSVERRLAELGIVLPRPPRAIGNFAYGVEHQGMLYLSGTYGTAVNAQDEDYLPIAGKLGAELAIEDGYRSARLMAINHLAMAKAVLGSLDRIVRVIRLLGFVNAAPGFRDAPKVLNGASDLLVEVFGPERGRHARSALYQHELARDAPVAGELTLAVRDG
jgi:enamine deaminase RidA (YjgF/YER057c/UK114 family)